MRSAFALLLCLTLPACGVLGGLTPLKTEFTVEGPAESLRYLATGEGAPTAGAPVAVRYSTSADKAVGLQIDNTYGDDGQPATLFVDFTSASDSEVAGSARARDNDRLKAQTDTLVTFAGQLVTLGALVGGAPGVTGQSPAPSASSDLEQLIAVLAAARGQGPAGPGTTEGLDAAQLIALLQALQPAPPAPKPSADTAPPAAAPEAPAEPEAPEA